ncbi:MAG: hypothetical protein K6U79_03075 [Firmicutes bacterium]|nr:hypothetical protein [Bacillota bacterium]
MPPSSSSTWSTSPSSSAAAGGAVRRAHALLLVGAREATERAALDEARRALCQRGHGCGECASCRRAEAGAHPDWLAVEPPSTGSLGVEDVYRALRWLALHPVAAARRVLLFRQADRLSGVAQNALLKALEEPPGDALLLLATALPDRLLPTIRSRCTERHPGRGRETESREGSSPGEDGVGGGDLAAACFEALFSPRPAGIWELARDWATLGREELEARLGAVEEALAASFRPPSGRDGDGGQASWPARLRVVPARPRLEAARSLARAAEALRANVGGELVLDVLLLELRRLWLARGPERIGGGAPE